MTDAAAHRTPLDTRAIWAIALPAMVTNVATALIGVGDMWIVGQLGDAPTQGAVDIGAKLFAALFTVMNFLKTGTTGLVAQAGIGRVRVFVNRVGKGIEHEGFGHVEFRCGWGSNGIQRLCRT